MSVDKLRHFGQYSLKIRACHANAPENIDQPFRKRCSEYAKLEVQTYPDKTADNVFNIRKLSSYNYKNSNVKIAGDDKMDNQTLENSKDKENENKGEPVFITWDPPLDPNLLIVNYNIKMITDANSQNILNTCETAKSFKTSNNR